MAAAAAGKRRGPAHIGLSLGCTTFTAATATDPDAAGIVSDMLGRQGMPAVVFRPPKGSPAAGGTIAVGHAAREKAAALRNAPSGSEVTAAARAAEAAAATHDQVGRRALLEPSGGSDRGTGTEDAQVEKQRHAGRIDDIAALVTSMLRGATAGDGAAVRLVAAVAPYTPPSGIATAVAALDRVAAVGSLEAFALVPAPLAAVIGAAEEIMAALRRRGHAVGAATVGAGAFNVLHVRVGATTIDAALVHVVPRGGGSADGPEPLPGPPGDAAAGPESKAAAALGASRVTGARTMVCGCLAATGSPFRSVSLLAVRAELTGRLGALRVEAELLSRALQTFSIAAAGESDAGSDGSGAAAGRLEAAEEMSAGGGAAALLPADGMEARRALERAGWLSAEGLGRLANEVAKAVDAVGRGATAEVTLPVPGGTAAQTLRYEITAAEAEESASAVAIAAVATALGAAKTRGVAIDGSAGGADAAGHSAPAVLLLTGGGSAMPAIRSAVAGAFSGAELVHQPGAGAASRGAAMIAARLSIRAAKRATPDELAALSARRPASKVQLAAAFPRGVALLVKLHGGAWGAAVKTIGPKLPASCVRRVRLARDPAAPITADGPPLHVTIGLALSRSEAPSRLVAQLGALSLPIEPAALDESEELELRLTVDVDVPAAGGGDGNGSAGASEEALGEFQPRPLSVSVGVDAAHLATGCVWSGSLSVVVQPDAVGSDNESD